MTFTNFALFIITVMGAAVTYFVVPFVKSKFSVAELEKLKFWVNAAVRFYEEKIKSPGMGAVKKKAVLGFLKEKGFDITEDELDMIIDAAVNELNSTEWSV